jgi:transposase
MSKSSISSNPVRYCLGIDVSKDDLSVCFSQMGAQQCITVKGSRKVENNLRGWKSLQSWFLRFVKDKGLALSIVMEATGVYYEGVAYFLRDEGFKLSVVLPNKSKHYAKSLNVKTKNDLVDARILAQMGLERNLPEWNGLKPTMRKIKQLCRERDALVKMRTVVSNQLHAHTWGSHPQKAIVQRLQQHIKFISKQIKVVEAEIQKVYIEDADLKQRVDNICIVKGLGPLTVLTVVAEADGFELIRNKNQLVSYAGYDVVQNESGTSLKGKTRISKKGNSHIRRALFFPALAAARFEPSLHALYHRIHERNPKIKMIGSVAVQRKLLVLIYTLYKKNEPYNPNFENEKAA